MAAAVVQWAQLTPAGAEARIVSGGRSFTVRVPSYAWKVRAALDTWNDQDQPLTTHREYFVASRSRADVAVIPPPHGHGLPLLVWLRRLP